MLKLTRLVPASLILAAAIATQAAPAAAQQPGAPELSINQIDAGGFPDVRLVVTALDARGVPASGLTAADFTAAEGQAALQIANVQPAQDQGLTLGTVITIDVSGSMRGAPFESAKAAAKQFVDSMGANDQAALIAFSDKVTPVVPLTADKAALTRGIDSLTAGGDTALYDAVQTSAYIASSSNVARKAVIFLTDGKNETQNSTATLDGSISSAKGSAIPMFTIGFGDEPDVPYLQGLATDTQGAYRSATASNLGSVYADIATLLRNQYVVTVRANGTADGKDASVRVSATVGGAPAVAVGAYKRGTAPAVAVQPIATPSTNTPPKPKSSSRTPALVFGIIIGAVGLALAGYVLLAWLRRRRVRRAQLKVVAPNAQQAAAQPLDPNYRAPLSHATNGMAGLASGTGLLRDTNGTGQVYPLGAGPAIIGTSARACNIVLPPSDQVAGEHLRIWLRDGRYVLHHVGGVGRKTYVGGNLADWVTLEPGDEVRLGPYRLIFEDPGK